MVKLNKYKDKLKNKKLNIFFNDKKQDKITNDDSEKETI